MANYRINRTDGVININGLTRPVRETNYRIKWYELDKWLAEQEKYFLKHNITEDQDKIEHIILNIDVIPL